MANQRIREYYDDLATRITAADATRNAAPDFTEHDVTYMRPFLDASASLLDLGAGTGLLLNQIMHGFANVVAVEMYPEFSRFIDRAPHVRVVNTDLLEFRTDQRFDVITLFGVMNYFDATEAGKLYARISGWLNPAGTLIVKHQMGRTEDVIVDGVSAELQRRYYSEYRTPENETVLIETAGMRIVRQDDIYPERFNRWPNTRFVALQARQQGAC